MGIRRRQRRGRRLSWAGADVGDAGLRNARRRMLVGPDHARGGQPWWARTRDGHSVNPVVPAAGDSGRYGLHQLRPLPTQSRRGRTRSLSPSRARRAERSIVPTPNSHNRAALAACNHFIAKIAATKEANASRELASWLPALTRYAVCMRSHDIDMLDPGPQGQLNLGTVPGITTTSAATPPSSARPTPPAGTFSPLRVHDDGTGP